MYITRPCLSGGPPFLARLACQQPQTPWGRPSLESAHKRKGKNYATIAASLRGAATILP
jgi:hypothetical protein